MADIERAFRQLASESPELASVVTTTYFRPELWHLSKKARWAVWGAEHGVSAGTAWVRYAAAERRLLELLNGGVAAAHEP